ncbi:basic leucine zipper 43-like [Neltuma alba]|uniref:basic leucine zipper 43-like n=1 Tax=Neltuma alba TaxID=207710 RepID=UPI0010A32659|nr:basic leucine zipper 43-like [Prosopis alba]
MEGHEAEKLYGIPSSSSTQHPQFASATEKPILNMETVEEYHVLAHLDQFQSSHYIPLYYSQVHHLPSSLNQIQRHKSSPDASLHSNNNEVKAIVDDQKRRRMLSNRESARKSRIRKKQQIESLQFRVNDLQTMNDQLSRKIIGLLECNQQMLQQNVQLKEKVSSLQEALSELLIPNGPVAEVSQA